MSTPERQLAHRLRSPLTVIHGFADVLAGDDGELSPEERREYAARIKRAADELAAMIDDFAPRDGGG